MKELAAVIVEDRSFENFGEICHNHLKFLPKETQLFVFTSTELMDEYKKQLLSFGINPILKPFEELDVPTSFNRIPNAREILINNPRLQKILKYSLFFTSSQFWKSFLGYERVLVFQMDSSILRNGIEEFYKWDYIGAPTKSLINETPILNGGLSLRNPNIMEYICRYYGWESDIEDLIRLGKYSSGSFFAEDIFFCLRMVKYGIGNYPTSNEAKKFSMEMELEMGTFGVHNIQTYHSKEVVDRVLNQFTNQKEEEYLIQTQATFS